MTRTIEFYFDFSSPYGYFASHAIDDIAAKYGREAVWKPIMLGPVLKETGARPNIEVPIKGAYCRRDWERLGRFMGVPWVLPDPFPIATLAAARAFYWLHDRDPAQARLFAKTAFAAYFGAGRDITAAETVADLAGPLHVDRDELLAALQDPAVKERLKTETGEAIGKGVCGSPFIFVDGEGFWGSDRLWMVRRWLKSGGW